VNKLLLSFLLLFFLKQTCSWAEPEDIQERVKQIEQAVQKDNKHLSALRKQIKELNDALPNLEVEIKSLSERENNISLELRDIANKKKLYDQEISSSQAKLDQLLKSNSGRVRSLYMQSTQGPLANLFTLLKGNNINKASYYAAVVQQYDHKVFDSLSEVSASMQIKTAELGKLMLHRDTVRANLAKQREGIKIRLAHQKSVIKELEQRKLKVEETLTELRAQALRLETVVASITRGTEDRSYGTVGSHSQVEVPKGSFNGNGFAGKLGKPVSDGKVKRGYGRQRVRGFTDFVFNKGIEFATNLSSEVKAIADGRVIHTGRMPGYGTILIIDHGHRQYSLYGRLGGMLVQKGETVEAGSKIGIVGAAKDGVSGILYFEMRDSGRPIDPKQFFKRL